MYLCIIYLLAITETNLFYTYFKSVFVGAELKVLMCYMHIDLQPEWLVLNE